MPIPLKKTFRKTNIKAILFTRWQAFCTGGKWKTYYSQHSGAKKALSLYAKKLAAYPPSLPLALRKT
jgi:hypothetical protein